MADEIRRSQIITTFGVGAITELKQFTGILKSPDVWQPALISRLRKEEKIDDPRLSQVLGVDYFLMPPRKAEKSAWLEFTLFPRMLFCPKCKSLKDVKYWFKELPHYSGGSNDVKPWEIKCTCNEKGTKLIPSRFITICPKGHLDDFPFYEWVHYYNDCPQDNLEKRGFKMRSSGGGATLGDIKITCDNCKKMRTLEGALYTDNHLDYSCNGNRPELFNVNPYNENCNEPANNIKFVLRSASIVYFPKIYSSLLIPPFTHPEIEYILEQSTFYDLKRSIIENNESDTIFYKKHLIDLLLHKFNVWDEKKANSCITSLLSPNETEIDLEAYKYDEYLAFSDNTYDNNFIIELQDCGKLDKFGINKLIKVTRLKEVRVLAGFSRVRPFEADFELLVEDEEEENAPDQNVSFIRSCSRKLNWLPGVDLFGEGIFISFDNKYMANHESSSRKRIEQLMQNSEQFRREGFFSLPFNARFIALHTLSHQIIKLIAFSSGYPLASVRERIYCNTKSNDEMNAILIYIADTDSEGTLGGLCRLGTEDKILELISGALEYSEWCSSDPVCRESSGQGLGSLNLAACHSCTLLPETCCEFGNRYLDRITMENYFKK
jgi:hypothetical protein